MPSYEPFSWNVVINASWNRAILTPGGIATKLFGLPKGSGVEVLVPIEGLEPPKVMHDGMIVTASSSRLVIDMNTQDYDGIEKAMKIARAALDALPETPVSAAGYNIRFKGTSTDTALSQIIESPLHALSDCGCEIISHGLLRQIRFGEGVINLTATVTKEGVLTLELNFHRGSSARQDLVTWLTISKEDLKAEVLKLASALQVPITEEADVKNK